MIRSTVVSQKNIDGEFFYFIYDREDVILDYVDRNGAGVAGATLDGRYLHGPGIDQVLAQEEGDEALPLDAH